MKRILLIASAIAGMFLTAACQQELYEPETNGTVTYEITLPSQMQTKASHEYAEYDLYYEVYKTVSDTELADNDLQPLFEKRVDMTGNTHTLNLELLNNQSYTILFWANKKGVDYYNLGNLRNVVMKQCTSNNDDRDAFCGKDQITDVTTAAKRTVELTRPFAQVNIATLVKNAQFDITPVSSSVEFTNIPNSYNVLTGKPGENVGTVVYDSSFVPEDNLVGDYKYVAMNYIFVPYSEAGNSIITSVRYYIDTPNGTVSNSVPNVPVKKNYRTNIIGNLLTSGAEYTITVEPGFSNHYTVEVGGTTSVTVTNEDEFNAAFEDNKLDVIVLDDDIDLNELSATRAASTHPTYTIGNGRTVTIDLNGKKLSATSAQSGQNYATFIVKGNLTVKNGTIEIEHVGENMLWNKMTTIFDVTAGGVLNLEGVTAKNLGGSDMGFVAHLNNWGEVTLNAENCTLESNYVPVRVFNSGYDMNNVTIKNSTLKGVSAAFWVHNYTVEDFGTAEKAEAQKTLLNLNIYNQGNTFSPDVNGVRYGFTNSVRADAYGITKTVSEDGTVVTLGSVIDNGLVRRGVAGTEENTTITEAIVGEGITTLYDRTFRHFYALKKVVLPSTLTTIGAAGSGVFQSCTALEDIVIPESVTVIGKGTFQECSSLKSINIPAGVTRIEENALRATGLVSVEFHEGVTYFGVQAFRDCKSLKEVVIKAPQFTIEANSFGSMAAPYPAVTIYVANAEMKAYLESTLTYANQFDIVVPGLVNTVDEFKEALADDKKDVITLAAGVTYEGTFNVNRNVKIVSENVASGQKATIKGRVEVRSANPTFENVNFDRNETDSNNAMQTSSNALQYRAVVMIYGDQNNKVTFKKCNFYNNNGTHQSAITNVAVDLVVDECYFEGRSSSIYSQANLSVTNSTFNYTGGNNVILSINGCGDNGGKVIFKNNEITNNKIFALSQFLSTVGFGNGTYHFDVQDNEGAGFDHYFLNEERVANKTFADGSVTF